MKCLGHIWPDVIRFENLLNAFYKARKGKKKVPAVARFSLELESNLLALQRELESGDYWPGTYRLFTIYERKPRFIAAAPFRDRVVHHAVMNIIEPPIDRRFVYHSYACRKNKGVHAAVDKYQAWSHKYPYVLKMDVERYFPSIDRAILKQKLRKFIKDIDALSLLDRIIENAPVEVGRQDAPYFSGDDLLSPLEHSVGLPIGNLTSQFFANLYLNDLDHSIVQKLGTKAYLRYVDDLIVLGRDKSALHTIHAEIQERLAHERLRLHPNKSHIYHAAHGMDLFGYHVFPTHRRLRNDNGHTFARRLRQLAKRYNAGDVDFDEINPRIQSWIGHAVHGDTYRLREAIFSSTVFTRA